MNIATKETIILPKSSVERLLDAGRFFEMAQDEIEDFLITRNRNIVAKIKKARLEHLNGKTKDFKNLLGRHV